MKPFFSELAIKTATLVMISLAGVTAKFCSIKLTAQFIVCFLGATLFFTVIVISLARMHRLIQMGISRHDLWSRLSFQAPFVNQIRDDEQERTLYGQSILRKLDTLADHHRKFVDEPYCSRYIGAAAFYANEKRANVRWETFRDTLVANFKELILKGKIMPHVINDHYKGKYEDLLDAARRKHAEIG